MLALLVELEAFFALLALLRSASAFRRAAEAREEGLLISGLLYEGKRARPSETVRARGAPAKRRQAGLCRLAGGRLALRPRLGGAGGGPAMASRCSATVTDDPINRSIALR